MDAPSDYFFSLEKKRGPHEAINSLLSDTRPELTELQDINQRATQFFKALCSSEYEGNPELEGEFMVMLPQVSEHFNFQLDHPFHLEELSAPLQSWQA